jgi:hypothetical protein
MSHQFAFKEIRTWVAGQPPTRANHQTLRSFSVSDEIKGQHGDTLSPKWSSFLASISLLCLYCDAPHMSPWTPATVTAMADAGRAFGSIFLQEGHGTILTIECWISSLAFGARWFFMHVGCLPANTILPAESMICSAWSLEMMWEVQYCTFMAEKLGQAEDIPLLLHLTRSRYYRFLVVPFHKIIQSTRKIWL